MSNLVQANGRFNPILNEEQVIKFESIDDDLVTINEQPLNSTSVNLLDLPDLENEGSVLVQNGKLSSLFFCFSLYIVVGSR